MIIRRRRRGRIRRLIRRRINIIRRVRIIRRKKIEVDPKNPKFLQTIRGAGYVLWIE